ncbi:hypothetical protein GCM10010411_52940 [Actinomadura fulvescens]|uniref:Uncharacterized protein n=1 Tax=Actinomadura fulvescens TaxID=46160 RepID=A0ABN3Q0Z0_9ACTN
MSPRFPSEAGGEVAASGLDQGELVNFRRLKASGPVLMCACTPRRNPLSQRHGRPYEKTDRVEVLTRPAAPPGWVVVFTPKDAPGYLWMQERQLGPIHRCKSPPPGS